MNRKSLPTSCVDNITDQAANEIKICTVITTTIRVRQVRHSEATNRIHLSTEMTILGPNRALLTQTHGPLSRRKTYLAASTVAVRDTLLPNRLLSSSTTRKMNITTFTD